MTHLKLLVDHCKKYAAANGKKYSECLKDSKCREMYHSQNKDYRRLTFSEFIDLVITFAMMEVND